MRTSINILFVLLLLSSCTFKKEYSYILIESKEGLLTSKRSLHEKNPEIIKAASDSDAYKTAFRNYVISLRVSEEMKKQLNYTTYPVGFKLLNEKKIDITNTTFFVGKKEFEEKILAEMANVSLPEIKQSKDESTSKNVSVDSIKIKELKSFFTIKKDEFDPDGTQWMRPKNASKYVNTNNIYCYFEVKNGIAKNFRFRFQYYSDEWLFIQKCQFSIDGKAFEFIPSNVQTDSGNGGYIWEWFDENVRTYDLSLIEAIASANVAKVKLVGRQYYDIKTLSKEQIASVKKTLEMYKAMGGTF
jgi:hypothetical protein